MRLHTQTANVILDHTVAKFLFGINIPLFILSLAVKKGHYFYCHTFLTFFLPFPDLFPSLCANVLVAKDWREHEPPLNQVKGPSSPPSCIS